MGKAGTRQVELKGAVHLCVGRIRDCAKGRATKSSPGVGAGFPQRGLGEERGQLPAAPLLLSPSRLTVPGRCR